MNAPYANWQSVRADGTRPALVSICVAARPIVAESLNEMRPGGYPGGRPPKDVVRAAARELFKLTERSNDPQMLGRRAIALMALTDQPLREDGEIEIAVADSLSAVEFAQRSGDPVVTALAYFRLGMAYGSSQQPQQSLEAHHLALQQLGGADLTDANHWLHNDVPFLGAATEPGLGFSIKYRCLIQLSRMNRASGDASNALKFADAVVEFVSIRSDSESVGYAFPDKYGWALSVRSAAERAACDTKAFLQTQAELEQLADREEDPHGVVHRYWWQVTGANAWKLRDFGLLERMNKRRLVARAAASLNMVISEDDITPDTVTALIQQARQRDSKKTLTNIGNVVYEIVRGRQFGGVFDGNTDARHEGLQLLGTIENAWTGFAVNGTEALRLSRARIALLEPNPPLTDLTATLLSVQAKALQRYTGFNALVLAVRHGTVGSTEVRTRLHELLSATDSERSGGDNALLRGLLAEWWYRLNSNGGTATQPVDWRAGEEAALQAARLLRPAGVSLDPELEAIVWEGAADAATAHGGSAQLRLERLLHAVLAVAELMMTVSTTTDRARHATRFSHIFATAADLAEQLDDHLAADIIMEAARRDRVGLILAELARNPEVDAEIRSAALAVAESSSTTPVTESRNDDDPEPDEGESDSVVRHRSLVILDDRRRATTHVEHILGPLGQLCDPKVLETISAASVLASRPNSAAVTVVLQLLPSTATLLGSEPSADTVRVYRRMTWALSTDSVIQEYQDWVDVRAQLLVLSAGDPATFAWAGALAEAVLPRPLLHLLAETAELPIRLLVVPTGFFHVPFDALPVAHDRLLVDCADVTVHGSLTSMLALMGIESTAGTSPSIAVYDTREKGGVRHAAEEYSALTEHLGGVVRAHTAAELSAHLTRREDADAEPLAMLAMGVHGSGDDQGWGQAKEMPDGTVITAAQVLGWEFPRLCVLASCHSAITAADGVELGGFPLALMLRGAVTVIGGLYDIDDLATTQIMRYFWQAFAAGETPLCALRHAKQAWLHDDPNRRQCPRLWAGLIAYGATTE